MLSKKRDESECREQHLGLSQYTFCENPFKFSPNIAPKGKKFFVKG